MRICLCLALLLFAAGCRQTSPRDARLERPGDLARETAGQELKNVFVNPGARAVFAGRGLPLAPASPQDAAALRSPSVWRKLDRAERFDGVLLAGPAAEFHELLGHLASSPDFQLVRVDNWGALFVRGAAEPYHPPLAGDAAKEIQNAMDRGIYLGQMALMLDAAGFFSPAGDYLAAALKSAPDSPDVQVCAAALALSRKHYSDALQAADRALSFRPHDLAALEIQTRAFAAIGATDRAWKSATKLKSLAPENMNLLFLHARISNAAHAYSAEQDSLETLIQLAEKQNLSPTDYRVYLGQCFARQGLARPALLQLELALKDPSISKKQREDLTNAVKTVREKSPHLAE